MKTSRRKPGTRSQHGMTLIELGIAMLVLTVGMTALLALITIAIMNNGKAKADTGGTLVAQMVIETISAQSNPAQVLTITDCNGTVWTISGQTAASPGAGATLTANGGIDFLNQTYAAVTANYKMQYRECGNNGLQTVYDVRWNVRTIDALSRLVTVSARPVGVTNNSANSARMFELPVTLRTIVTRSN